MPWGGIYEIATAALPMPELPMGFRFSEEEMLPLMWHVAADRVGCAHRCRAHRNKELLDVGANQGEVGLHS